MPKYQVFNPRIKAWVKYEVKKGRSYILDVKTTNPRKPFKYIRKKK